MSDGVYVAPQQYQIGHFLNVKPTLGLLTTTARTFIQDGVTTEYASQLIGTTLDNGRVYAQLLTKTSRVLYGDGPTTTSSNSGGAVITRIIEPPKDIKGNLVLSDDDDDIDNGLLVAGRQFISTVLPVVVRNTDYVETVNSGKVTPVKEEIQPSYYFPELKVIRTFNQQLVDEEERPDLAFRTSKSLSDDKDFLNFIGANEINAPKVRNIDSLETITIKQSFQPSSVETENVEKEETSPNASISSTTVETMGNSSTRGAKLLQYPKKEKLDPKDLPSVTYYGFAEFTTIVGDTVIVFSPKTNEPQRYNPAAVTSIIGDATLKQPEISEQEITKSRSIIPSATIMKEIIQPTTIVSQEVVTLREAKKLLQPVTEASDNKLLEDPDEESTTPQTTEKQPEPLEDIMAIQSSEGTIELESSMSQSSTVTPISSTATVMLSKPSEEDITKILASLAAAKESQLKKEQENIETHVSGGVTTIFFEDDPFLAVAGTTTSTSSADTLLLSPSETQATTSSSTASTTEVVTPAEEVTTEAQTEIFEGTTSETTQQMVKEESATESETTESTITETESTEKIPLSQNDNESVNDEEKVPLELCIQPTQTFISVIPSTIYKTLTYLTTYFIPVESIEGQDNGASETTSINERREIVTETIQVTQTKTKICATSLPTEIESTTVTESDEAIEEPTTQESTVTETSTDSVEITTESLKQNDDSSIPQTTPLLPILEIVTEKRHITTTPIDEETDDTESTTQEIVTTTTQTDEEIELIYKTLYTTYTYLTTFFHESTSSVVSRKEIVTNIVTSTIDAAMRNIFNQETIDPSSAVSGVGVGRPTTTEAPFNFNNLDSLFFGATSTSDESSVDLEPTAIDATPSLKTYYTTYTYFTTIFVDGETEVTSRTEVYTNIVGKGAATLTSIPIEPTEVTEFAATEKPSELATTEQPDAEPTTNANTDDDEENLVLASNVDINSQYKTVIRNKTPSLLSENEIKYETNILNSTSSESRYQVVQVPDDSITTETVPLDDQLSLESNTHHGREILDITPAGSSPETLLLQTSYTTFTYFTTMYLGTTSSNILSRLETVTNIVTETIHPTTVIDAIVAPTESVKLEDDVNEGAVPITYFTTFTYWTTLYKDDQIVTTSREETVSNVVTSTPGSSSITIEIPSDTIKPTNVVEAESSSVTPEVVTEPAAATVIAVTQDAVPTIRSDELQTESINSVEQSTTTELESSKISPTTVADSTANAATTFYTTYTYYTTSYVGDETVLQSRLEVVTSVASIPPVIVEPTARAIDIKAAVVNAISGDEKPSKDNESNNDKIEPSAAIVTAEAPTIPTEDIISINYGKIVDASGVSTILYTTKAIGSLINDFYAQVISSTSTIVVDSTRKAELEASQSSEATIAPPSTNADGEIIVVPSTPSYKLGLVRSIEGTQIANRTTTLYQSKVIGTLIDGRYAQIIESTSSYLIERTSTPAVDLSVTPTIQVSSSIEPTKVAVLETSSGVQDENQQSEKQETDEESDDEDDDENGDNKFKPFASRKRTFTPVIRPFASRNRPTFQPKRKNVNPTSATIITRSDNATPTITATPALKLDSASTRSRFSGGSRNRFSSGGGSPSSALSSTGRSRFSRPRFTASASSGFNPAQSSSTVSGSSSIPRYRSSSIRPSASNIYGSSSRRVISGRSSSLPVAPGRASSILPGSRFRIKPTSVHPGLQSTISAAPTLAPSNDVTDIDDNSITTVVTDGPEVADEEQPTTENSRRSSNPLLRFRRPPLNAPRPTSAGRATNSPAISTRRSPLSGRTRATSTSTTTTTTPKPRARSFPRPPPSLNSSPNGVNRPRPVSNLFPPRGLFNRQSSTTAEPETTLEEQADYEDGGEESFGGDGDGDDEGPVNRSRRNDKKSYPFRPSKSRSKRQIDYGTRSSYQPRFRTRSRAPQTPPPPIDDYEDEPITERPARPTNRYTSNRNALANRRTNSNTNNIRPTSASSSGSRSQFTLRGGSDRDNKPTSSGYRRPATTGRRQSVSSQSTRSGVKPPRLRTYSNSGSSNTRSNNRRTTTKNSRNSGRNSVPTNRGRGRNGFIQDDYTLQPSFDGTITVTHQIPVETTIPIINGKQTEYKNILTAKISTEILPPNKYTTVKPGQLAFISEHTQVAANGATEVTQFLINETPTTTVIFTPTTIRGRKTSFSHVIPSTIYNVIETVSTQAPVIDPNAPLANILLSQLLLGLPQQQQQPNPFLQLQQPQAIAPTPHTEYKTHTSTYVTTITNGKSTVLPVTFRGKEILTTIYDSSVDVITATEVIVDTNVITPSVQFQQPIANPFNLLAPQPAQQQQQQLLLQLLAQQQQMQAVQQTVAPPQPLVTSNDSDEDLDQQEPALADSISNDDQKLLANKQNHKQFLNKKFPAAVTVPPPPPRETSVITLYVSGRQPGEFSTVLSTVYVGDDFNSAVHRKRREIDIEPSPAALEPMDKTLAPFLG